MSESNNIKWIRIRVAVNEEMHDDLKYIKERTGMSVSDYTRFQLTKVIEELAVSGLYVGQKRHLREKES